MTHDPGGDQAAHEAPLPSDDQAFTSSKQSGRPAEQLDLETVVRASQTISGELVQPKLIAKFVRSAMEYGAVDRCLLILIRDGAPRIEAEGNKSSGRVDVTLRQAPVSPSDLSQSVLLHVMETQKQVLLDDASIENAYSNDEYLQQKPSKSVLCLPIIQGSELVGALYLENNLIPGVFTPERVTVLKLLASQAAISMENASLYSEIQLQAGLLQYLPVSAWTLKPDGTPDFVNRVWLEFAGQTLDFVRSRPDAWMSAVHPEDREAAATAFWGGVLSGQGFAVETRSLRAQDKTYRWHFQQAVVLRDADGKVVKFVGTTTDIDDQKHAEEEVRASELRLRELTADLDWRVAQRTSELAQVNEELRLQVEVLQRIPVSAWTLRPDGTPDFVNQVWLQFTGQTLNFVRSHPEAWMTAVHPDDQDAVLKAFWDGVHSGQGFVFEARTRCAEDGTFRWHLHQAVVLRDAEGSVLKFVGTSTDIDDQKRAQEALRQAQSDLARINRVTTMGELAGSLAHEISQPIGGAMTNAATCLRRLGGDKADLDEVRAGVTKILRDAQRAAAIIDRIRSQFQKSTPIHGTLDVSDIIQEIITLLRGEAVRYNISVRTELATDLPKIIGDRVQLQQVAMNLFVNSIEAMKDVDGLREMVVQSQRSEGELVLVSVRDTGIGFPPSLSEEIFDPFFTTKPQGTGLGLRISRSIIESHGGRLWATSNDGPGATFSFSIPIPQQA